MELTYRFVDEIVAIIYFLIEYKCFIKTQHKNILKKFKLKQMFRLSEKYMFGRSILKCGYIRYTEQSKLSANIANEKLYIEMLREDSVISSKDSYLQIEIDILDVYDNKRFFGC